MKKRDKSQLKFSILQLIKSSNKGVSKYKMKKQLNIPTSKQLNLLLGELLDKGFVKEERIERHQSEGGTTFLFYLTEKGMDFLMTAEHLLKDFFGINDLE